MDFNPFSIEGKTILIIGASSGIGENTFYQCHRLGANTIGVSRKEYKALYSDNKDVTNGGGEG